MPVNRRAAIRQFLFASAGVAFLPACVHHDPGSSILLKNFTVSADQEKLLAQLAGTIIPAGATPGAAAVSAHLFALKMLDDCYSKEQQQKFLKGLRQLDDLSKTAAGQRFVETSPAQRESLLTAIESRKTPGEELHYFYGEIKKLTIQAYTSSQFFLTKVHVYELVPGRWHADVPVRKNLNKGA